MLPCLLCRSWKKAINTQKHRGISWLRACYSTRGVTFTSKPAGEWRITKRSGSVPYTHIHHNDGKQLPPWDRAINPSRPSIGPASLSEPAGHPLAPSLSVALWRFFQWQPVKLGSSLLFFPRNNIKGNFQQYFKIHLPFIKKTLNKFRSLL